MGYLPHPFCREFFKIKLLCSPSSGSSGSSGTSAPPAPLASSAPPAALPRHALELWHCFDATLLPSLRRPPRIGPCILPVEKPLPAPPRKSPKNRLCRLHPRKWLSVCAITAPPKTATCLRHDDSLPNRLRLATSRPPKPAPGTINWPPGTITPATASEKRSAGGRIPTTFFCLSR